MTLGGEFDAVAACVRTSALFRAADSIATACLTAADRSAVAARVRDARARFASLPGDGRLRADAICVAMAAAGHLLLLLLVPARIAPGTPKMLWMVVAATATIVALCAQALAASWETSVLRSVFRSAGLSRLRS
jgi:hypothetical protein